MRVSVAWWAGQTGFHRDCSTACMHATACVYVYENTHAHTHARTGSGQCVHTHTHARTHTRTHLRTGAGRLAVKSSGVISRPRRCRRVRARGLHVGVVLAHGQPVRSRSSCAHALKQTHRGNTHTHRKSKLQATHAPGVSPARVERQASSLAGTGQTEGHTCMHMQTHMHACTHTHRHSKTGGNTVNTEPPSCSSTQHAHAQDTCL